MIKFSKEKVLLLHKILAEWAELAVLPELRGFGEQGYIIQPECSGGICPDSQTAVN